MDGSIGQAAFDQAKAFHESVDVSGTGLAGADLALSWRWAGRRGAAGHLLHGLRAGRVLPAAESLG